MLKFLNPQFFGNGLNGITASKISMKLMAFTFRNKGYILHFSILISFSLKFMKSLYT